MRLFLAPMEGVINARMRALLTSQGGIDRCTTEFVRVTDQLLPQRVFLRFCPELADGGHTPSGTPVFVQLLGSNPDAMAANAQRAAQLGAPGIDINFGCPAKTVNRHRGGSVLLQEPVLLHDIVYRVRRDLPNTLPLTVKIRLGYSNDSLLAEIVDAITSAGATELVIHARTKVDGYKPPAHWHKLKAFAGQLDIPLIANGEIWSPQDYSACLERSGCEDVMLGRGVLASPGLPNQIKALQAGKVQAPLAWSAVLDMLESLLEHLIHHCPPRHVGGPVKQWLGYLRKQYPQADRLFADIKRLTAVPDLQTTIEKHRAISEMERAA